MPATTTLAGKEIGRVGLGLMMLTWGGDLPTDEESFTAIRTAVDNGSNYLNSATFYGHPENHEAGLQLLNRFFTAYPEYADRVILGVKGGIFYEKRMPSGELEFLRSDLKRAYEHLGDKKKIDIFEMARVPNDLPIEETIKNLVILKEEGYFNHIGLSEATADTLSRAHAVYPIACVEIELSLFYLEPSVLETTTLAEKLGVAIIAYSPLGRGFFSGKYRSIDDFPEGDIRKVYPRFQGDNFKKNLELVDKVAELAKKKGSSTSQLALAYIMHISPVVVPIPGSSNPKRIIENIEAANIELTDEDVKQIDEILKTFVTAGDRYPDYAKSFLMK
ncbi:NADP-dependent oxidoreductase domain-containing protein [Naematelia encephala]|uniref:NADP-dependent oxidoreductase domain-containing protein n=1 Tax=Naematelia encephala TaxID=71784 RepID=A0A1Y2BCQ3_9TREE|nr:NADP-dependent oxidoreductase domain-containing protein [Naematelia encephala]